MKVTTTATLRPVQSPMSLRWLKNWLPLVGLLVLGLLVLHLSSGYQLHRATQILVYAIAILSLCLLSGFSGQISLGHSAFLAIGGYVTAILIAKAGIPYWAAIPAGALVSMAIGFLVAFPALRLELLYLAMATFSLAVVVPQLVRNRLVSQWTGGFEGLSLPKPAAWTALGLDIDQTIFAFALLSTTAAIVVVQNLLDGRAGRAIAAVRDHPVAAEAMGISTRAYKTRTFALSSLLAGWAGGLGALAVQYVSPDNYAFFLSIALLVGAVIGGFRSIYGCVLGGAFVVLTPNYAEEISQGASWAIYGVITIVCMFAMPEGAAGVWHALVRALQKRAR